MLELVDVSRRYGEVVALDGVSLKVEPGQMRGLVGRNGAGKTTAMRIVLGLVEPDGGQVLWKGEPVDDARRRRIGYMPEERGLYPKMRVRDQLVFFGTLSGMEPGEARESATKWVDRLGVGDRANDKVETLSLGNQQRVQLAAALVHGPSVLVLDEPFSGLDPVGVDVLAGALKEEVGRGAAVVFSSHQLELVEQLCDAVTILDKGAVVASGGIEELRTRRGGRRLRVELETGATEWAGTDGPGADGPATAGTSSRPLPGVIRVRLDGHGVVLDLADDADSQAILDAARAAGRVRVFTPVTPRLSELFREVVQA